MAKTKRDTNPDGTGLTADGSVRFDLPVHITVPVPRLAAAKFRDVTTAERVLYVTALTPDTIANLIMHGAKQLLGDTVAGEKDAKGNELTVDELVAKVDEKLAEIHDNAWVPGSRGTRRDEVDVEVAAMARALTDPFRAEVKVATFNETVKDHGAVVTYLAARVKTGNPATKWSECVERGMAAAAHASNRDAILAKARANIAKRSDEVEVQL